MTGMNLIEGSSRRSGEMIHVPAEAEKNIRNAVREDEHKVKKGIGVKEILLGDKMLVEAVV